MVNSCWVCFKWLLAIVAVALAVGIPYVWFGIDDEIRSRVEARLDEHYGPLGLDVRIASARLVNGDGILIRGLSIVDPSVSGPAAKLIDVEELYLSCQIAPEELIQGRLPITGIKVIRPTLHASRLPDGSWNVAGLWPLPKFDDRPNRRPVPVKIEGATLDLLDSLKQPARGLMLRNINVTLSPRETISLSPRETISQPPRETISQPPRETNQPVATDRSLLIQGDLIGDRLRTASFQGEFDPDSGSVKLQGRLKGLEISPELRDSLPISLQGKIASTGGFYARADVSFNVQRDPSRPRPLSFQITAELTGGHIEDPRLPYPMTDLAARIECSDTGYRVEEMTARWGPAELTLNCQGSSFDMSGPMTVWGHVENLVLDRRMAGLLPEQQRGLWDKYKPSGSINVEVNAAFDGQRWTPNLLVKCLDVSFTHHKFPYRMKRTAGTLHLVGQRMNIDLTSSLGDRPVRIVGEVNHPGRDYTGWVELEAKQITLDKDILAALPPKQQPVIGAMGPRGVVDYWGRFERRDPSVEKPNHRMLLTLYDCAIKYKKFAYPLEGIGGTIEIINGRLTLRDVRNGNVRCTGGWQPNVDGGRLDLHFIATDVPLEEPLRDALQPDVVELWSDLRPRGVIDLLDIHVAFLAASKHLDLHVTASKRPEKSTADNRSIAINPIFFPYRVENLHGTVTYHNGRVDMYGVAGRHGNTRLITGGFCQKTPDGGYRIQFRDLTVEQLRMDRDLLDAMSGKLKQLAVSLQFKGPLALRGALNLQRPGPRKGNIAARWDLTVSTQQGQLDCGMKLDNIHGDLRTVGYDYPGQATYCQGQMNLDAVTYQDFQFVDVTGPLELAEGRLLFGSRARRLGTRQAPAPLTAKIFGGTVTADAIVQLEKESAFRLQSQLSGGDLNQFAREMMSGRQKLGGRISASLDLQGTAAGTHTFRGGGNVRLRDADVFELPQMVAMLKVLSVRVPNRAAFTTGDVNYRISGSHIYFNQINLKGDAISLLGKGEADLDRKIKLNFFAVVGRDRLQIPLIRPLLMEASRQTMEIRVDGTVDDPRITQETFRGAKEFLQRLEYDLRRSTEPVDAFNPAREVLRGMRKLVQ